MKLQQLIEKEIKEVNLSELKELKKNNEEGLKTKDLAEMLEYKLDLEDALNMDIKEMAQGIVKYKNTYIFFYE